MAIVFEPLRRFMYPTTDLAIDPTSNNLFSFIVSGICAAYRLRIFDEDNNVVLNTNRIDNASVINNGGKVEHDVVATTLNAGNDYTYQFDAYGGNTAVSSVNIATDILTVNNHNLNSGDTIFIQSTGSLPAGTNVYTKYYIRKIDSNNISLHDTYEASRLSTGTKVDITSTGSGTITISNIATSLQIRFSANTTPTFALTSTTITSQSYEFVPIYTQNEEVLITSFKAYLYDAGGNQEKVTDEIFSSDVRYTFDGLRNGLSYKVRFTGVNARGQFVDTGLVDFTVSYTIPQLGIKPTVENKYERSSILIGLQNLVQIEGTVTGTGNYVPEFITPLNTAYSLTSGSNIVFDNIAMNVDYTFMHLWYPNALGNVGDIVRFDNTSTGDYQIIGYDGNRFYRIINGITFNNSDKALVSNTVYLIAVKNDKLIVIDYVTFP